LGGAAASCLDDLEERLLFARADDARGLGLDALVVVLDLAEVVVGVLALPKPVVEAEDVFQRSVRRIEVSLALPP
jgi:hypothetical protein